ncbi:hypothetical protein JMUB3936_1396 [Leptotrichia wadei]|uniref:Uncharacterized protein n=1 Tax=Leptotrichia wadei TaxID=157687 RepID=A0A510KTT0_9FUSO|nr:hypothetical protein [Leptotrichia wadei]BBM55112.1 hypothetical protein JMUB3936_1396 [Leptotrichia wadei]
MNDNGLTGSTAGTGLNQMFESLKDFKKRGKLEDLIGKVTDEKVIYKIWFQLLKD